MRIAIGSDHRGFTAKAKLLPVLGEWQHEVEDMGCDSVASSDYPDFAFAVARAVSESRADRGILFCGTGLGMCMAANKVRGVRAAPCHDSVTAEMSRRHNDANIICLSAELLGEDEIERTVRIWLETEFEGGRHDRRVSKITKFEQDNFKQKEG